MGGLLVGKAGGCDYVDRRGFVSLEFDDSHDRDYGLLFPLSKHKIKASFAVITEESDLGINHAGGGPLQGIYAAGHEIQDHTTRHDYMWATDVDTLDDGLSDFFPYTFATVDEWDSLCGRSLFILDSLGITVSGWNQPGGWGPGTIPEHPEWAWAGLANDSLYDLVAQRYSYMVAYGVAPNTAHLNLRGHNTPDRFQIFNVPHVTIDDLSPAEIHEQIADATASGLWFPAVAHLRNQAIGMKVTDLITWLDDKGISTLTVGQGVERVLTGLPEPEANQLPQARMLTDLDGNGKPDGFLFDCAWDVVTAPPVDSVRCLRVFGQCETFCYGPEAGQNSFSVWARAEDSTAFRVAYEILDFDWNVIATSWSPQLVAGAAWTLVDSTVWAGASMMIDPEADRLRFMLITDGADTAVFCCPALVIVPSSGVPVPPDLPDDPLVLSPNPILRGAPVRFRAEHAGLFDVRGRRLGLPCVRSGDGTWELPTADLAPGVYFLAPEGYASTHPSGARKIVILR
jgi:peptidoglycan/xylan/chitin deacetylase (PgdA/CDA1 family)